MDRVGYLALLGFVSALQFSIAVANILLGLALLMWLAHASRARRSTCRDSSIHSRSTPRHARLGCVFRRSQRGLRRLEATRPVPDRADGVRTRARGQGAVRGPGDHHRRRAQRVVGIIQFGVLQFDNLGRRPQGALGHYMTYSGVLMLVACAAAARILFTTDRLWPSLMMPALLVILGLTFTRSALVGACAGIAFLLLLKDFRLMAVMPVLAALFFVLAPPQVTNRFMSMFDSRDPTRVDRFTMLRVGGRMVAAHPLDGGRAGPGGRRYPEFLDSGEIDQREPSPSQRAGADCSRAGAAGAGRLGLDDLVARHRPGASGSRFPDSRFLAATALGCDRRDAGGGPRRSTTSATPSS